MKRLKELRELHADKKAELKVLHTTLETENRAMTEQEIALVEAIEVALAAFKKEIGALETMDEENKRRLYVQHPSVLQVHQKMSLKKSRKISQ